MSVIQRDVPTFCKVIWTVQAMLVAFALFTADSVSFWVSALALLWFAVFETVGIVNDSPGDTCSESVWKLLDVRHGRPREQAMVPLVFGAFAAALTLGVGLAVGVAEQSMGDIWRGLAATWLAVGTGWFLWRHFRWGGQPARVMQRRAMLV